jgi:hypothetical protein
MKYPSENDLVKAVTIYGEEIIAFYRDSCFFDVNVNTLYIEEEIKTWELKYGKR